MSLRFGDQRDWLIHRLRPLLLRAVGRSHKVGKRHCGGEHSLWLHLPWHSQWYTNWSLRRHLWSPCWINSARFFGVADDVLCRWRQGKQTIQPCTDKTHSHGDDDVVGSVTGTISDNSKTDETATAQHEQHTGRHDSAAELERTTINGLRPISLLPTRPQISRKLWTTCFSTRQHSYYHAYVPRVTLKFLAFRVNLLFTANP